MLELAESAILVSTYEVWMTTMVFSCSMSVRQRFDCNTFRPFLYGCTAIAINPSHLYERGWENVAHGHDPVCRYLLAAFHAAFPRSRCWRIIIKKKSKPKSTWAGATVWLSVRVFVCVCERLKYDHLCSVFMCSTSSMARQALSTATIWRFLFSGVLLVPIAVKVNERPYYESN